MQWLPKVWTYWKKCKNSYFVCAYCAGAHPSSTCAAKYNPYCYTCANCSGNHTTFYQYCPAYLKYKATIDRKNESIKAEWEHRTKENAISTKKDETPLARTNKKENQKIQKISKTEIRSTGNAIISKNTLATILKTILNPHNLSALQAMNEETRNKTIDEIVEKPIAFEKQTDFEITPTNPIILTQEMPTNHNIETKNEQNLEMETETPETPEEHKQKKSYAEITSPKNTEGSQKSNSTKTNEKITEQLKTVIKKKQ